MILDIVEIIECRALQDLKWRARVKLPTGVFLIGPFIRTLCRGQPGLMQDVGIADESGTLAEGEVFCQFQETEDKRPTIINCEVLVCRAPARQCSFMRCMSVTDRSISPPRRCETRLGCRSTGIEASEERRGVQHPGIQGSTKHVSDTVSYRKRPHVRDDLVNMGRLGGGDLDGDGESIAVDPLRMPLMATCADYTVIWDPRFVAPLREHVAMDYTAPPPKRVDKVTQADLNEASETL